MGPEGQKEAGGAGGRSTPKKPPAAGTAVIVPVAVPVAVVVLGFDAAGGGSHGLSLVAPEAAGQASDGAELGPNQAATVPLAPPAPVVLSSSNSSFTQRGTYMRHPQVQVQQQALSHGDTGPAANGPGTGSLHGSFGQQAPQLVAPAPIVATSRRGYGFPKLTSLAETDTVVGGLVGWCIECTEIHR